MFLLVGSSRQVVQIAARQAEEAWRRADVFIQRIAFFIGGNDLLALDVGKAGLELFQGGADQLAEQFFGVALGVHLGDSRQPCGGLHVQMDRVLGFGQATLGVLFPMLGQFSDFHGNLSKAREGRR